MNRVETTINQERLYSIIGRLYVLLEQQTEILAQAGQKQLEMEGKVRNLEAQIAEAQTAVKERTPAQNGQKHPIPEKGGD